MIKLGIVGAENSHSYSIGSVCNIKKAVPMRVTHIWGETRAFAKVAMEKGAIPECVKDWRDLLGKVDGVMIDHRHPHPHVEPAKFFIENKVPLFVDKPFTWRLRDAIMLLDMAAKRKAPITTFSGIPRTEGYQAFKKLCQAGPVTAFSSSGPADIKSKWGGIFFYGIHQVDAAVEALGTKAVSVNVLKSKPNAVATIAFENGVTAAIHCQKDSRIFSWYATTNAAALMADRDYVEGKGYRWRIADYAAGLKPTVMYDSDPYLNSARIIHNLIAKGTMPFSRDRMLAVVAILEAMQRSLDTGRPVKVARF